MTNDSERLCVCAVVHACIGGGVTLTYAGGLQDLRREAFCRMHLTRTQPSLWSTPGGQGTGTC